MTLSEARKMVEEDDKTYRDELFGELLAEFHYREERRKKIDNPKKNRETRHTDISLSDEHESKQTA